MGIEVSVSLTPARFRAIAGVLLGAALVLVPSCSPVEEVVSPQGAGSAVTNRLDVSPAVVNNLGITWEKATRGRLGIWRKVPGQLEVPESSVSTAPVPSARV